MFFFLFHREFNNSKRLKNKNKEALTMQILNGEMVLPGRKIFPKAPGALRNPWHFLCSCPSSQNTPPKNPTLKNVFKITWI